MDQLTHLARTIGEAIRQGRFGTPVSLRIADHSSADHGQIEASLARAIEAACSWLASEPELVDAQGGVDSGRISALLRFESGACALVTAGTCGASPPRIDGLVVGNQGVGAWESADPLEAELPDALPAPRPDPVVARRAGAMLGAIRKALGSPAATRVDERPVAAAPSPKGALPRPPHGVLLVAGGSTHQEDYARALAAEPRCKLVGLADEPGLSPRRVEANALLARELGIPVLPDLDAALARDDVHVVSICAEPERRAGIIVRAAEAGKHLYLDKPLAASVEEARRVAAAVQRAGVLSQMFTMVHTSMPTRARRLVQSGRLGEIRAVHVDLLFAKGAAGSAILGTPRAEDRRPTRFETTDSKRELYNVGVYPLVFLRWLLGRPVRRVAAVTGNYFFQEHQRNGMEDFGLMLLELEGGITASVAAGRTGWRSHPMGGVNRALIVGARGVACVDAFRPRLEVWSDEPPWLAPRTDPDDPMGFWRSTPIRLGLPAKRAWPTPESDPPAVADARAFLDRLERGLPGEVDASSAAAAMEVLLAAYESAATRRPVDVA